MGSFSFRSVQSLVLCALVCCTMGCSLQRPLSADTASQFNGRRLARTERHAQLFSSGKPTFPPGGVLGAVGGAVGGLVAAAMASDAAAPDFDESSVVDPAPAIARQLCHDLEQHYGLRDAARPVPFDSDDVTQITGVDPSADMVLDIWTDDFSLVPLREDLSKFHLHYVANLRLIDARAVHAIDGKAGLVIAEGTCEESLEAPSSSATRSELLTDGARRLKAELKQAVQLCIRDFRSLLLHSH